MSYKIGQKVIIYNDLFKIKRVEGEHAYFGCNEEGCTAIIMEPNIAATYIGEADPEYYRSASALKKSAQVLKDNLDINEACGEDTCDTLEEVIALAEKIMDRFKYIK